MAFVRNIKNILCLLLLVSMICILSKIVLMSHPFTYRATRRYIMRKVFKENERKKIIIVTTWRSGSTFLEELIGSFPGMFNHYEPLLIYRQRNFYSNHEPEAKKAQQIVRDLLECRFNEEYIESVREIPLKMFEKNQNLWNNCYSYLYGDIFCYEKEFLEEICKSHAWSVMKLVRLGVGLIKPFLENTSNTHVLFLVRDPRAVMNSRITTVSWCVSDECKNSSVHCNRLEKDIKDLKDLQTLFPDKITLVRYEDLALSPLETSKAIFKGLSLELSSEIKLFIDKHTKKNIDSPSSTTRESSKHVLSWTRSIDNKVLKEVERYCLNAMKILGYKTFSRLDKYNYFEHNKSWSDFKNT